jgi:hypothetical protein
VYFGSLLELAELILDFFEPYRLLCVSRGCLEQSNKAVIGAQTDKWNPQLLLIAEILVQCFEVVELGLEDLHWLFIADPLSFYALGA